MLLKNFQSFHLMRKDGMRNPPNPLPCRWFAMFRVRRLGEGDHSLWCAGLCDRTKVYRETVVFAI